MLAHALISDSIPTLRTSDTGNTALQLMNDYQVKHLPIVNNQQLLGLISEDDILEKSNPDDPIGSVQLTYYKPYVSENDHLYHVIKVCADLKLTLLPVVDTKKNYIGCITLDRIVQEFATLSSVTDPGGIITVSVNMRDYSASEIARIVESNNASILSLFTRTNANSSSMEVILKVNKESLKDIMATFERFDYKVLDVFHKSTFEDDMMDRYDSLIKYLNI